MKIGLENSLPPGRLVNEQTNQQPTNKQTSESLREFTRFTR